MMAVRSTRRGLGPGGGVRLRLEWRPRRRRSAHRPRAPRRRHWLGRPWCAIRASWPGGRGRVAGVDLLAGGALAGRTLRSRRPRWWRLGVAARPSSASVAGGGRVGRVAGVTRGGGCLGCSLVRGGRLGGGRRLDGRGLLRRATRGTAARGGRARSRSGLRGGRLGVLPGTPVIALVLGGEQRRVVAGGGVVGCHQAASRQVRCDPHPAGAADTARVRLQSSRRVCDGTEVVSLHPKTVRAGRGPVIECRRRPGRQPCRRHDLAGHSSGSVTLTFTVSSGPCASRVTSGGRGGCRSAISRSAVRMSSGRTAGVVCRTTMRSIAQSAPTS